MTARCIGSCGLAPVVLFDGEMSGKITPKALKEKLNKWTHIAEEAVGE